MEEFRVSIDTRRNAKDLVLEEKNFKNGYVHI